MNTPATNAPDPDPSVKRQKAASAALEQSLHHLEIVPTSMTSEAWDTFTDRICEYIKALHSTSKQLKDRGNHTIARTDVIKADNKLRLAEGRVFSKTIGVIGAAASGAAVSGIFGPLADAKSMSWRYLLIWAVLGIVGLSLSIYHLNKE